MALHDPDLWGFSDLLPEVSIEHRGPNTRERIRSILVPVAGGPHTGAAVDLSAAIAADWGATVTLVTVVPSTASDEERAEAADRLARYADGVDDVTVETDVIASDDVAGAIGEQSGNHEIVVIGATERPLFRRFFSGTVPERLEERIRSPLFVVKRDRY